MKLYKPLESARENLGPELQRKFYQVKDDSKIQVMNPLPDVFQIQNFSDLRKGPAVNMPYIT